MILNHAVYICVLNINELFKNVVMIIRISVIPALLIAFLGLGCGSNSRSNENHTYRVFTGTFTSNESNGIYLVRFDAEDGGLSAPELAAETSNSSFLSPEGEFLYAVNANDSGLVVSYQWDGQLEYKDAKHTLGAGPCYVAISESGRMAAVANYRSGSVAVFLVDRGKFIGEGTVRRHQGSGPNVDRQEGPHAHYCQFAHDDRMLYVVDLGIDEIVGYPIDGSGSVGQGHTALKLDGGDGPRHMAFYKDLVFIVNELSNTVVSAKADHENGLFEKIDKTSTLPPGFEGESFAADIHVADDGKYLYTSNRGHNSIAVFSIAKDGRLEWVGAESSGGDWPRNFAIAPGGDYMLVANQRSGNIVSFRIDANSGMPVPTGYVTNVPEAVCLQFAGVEEGN